MSARPTRASAGARKASTTLQASAQQPLITSQVFNVSKASHPYKTGIKLRLRLPQNARRGATSSSATRAASAYMLPVELLVEIFVSLSTPDVLCAAQVCKTWHAAASDSRVWRSITFPAVAATAAGSSTKEEQLRALVRRADGKIASVDLAYLTRVQMQLFVQLLEPSAQSLRHIRWSSGGDDPVTLRKVLRLAKLCPQLETLELRLGTKDTFVLRELLDAASGMLRPRHFSITAWSLHNRLTDLLESHCAIFDQATSLEFKAIDKGLCIVTLARLLKRNVSLQRLTLHRLCVQWAASGQAISAPSLQYLDLLYSHPLQQAIFLIDAPQLRELVIDARILSKLSAVSIVKLDALTLRLAGTSALEVALELAALEQIKHHQGRLKLLVGSNYTQKVLLLLCSDVWPGLEEVELSVDEGSATTLLAIIAARQAGARGATKKQYVFVLQDTLARLKGPSSRPTTRALKAEAQRETLDDIAAASAVKSNAAASTKARPLCASVTWKINTPALLPASIVEWLKDQPNVQLLW